MNNNLHISLMILAATSVYITIITCTNAGVVIQTTDRFTDETPYECGRNLTLTCMFLNNAKFIVWRNSISFTNIAKCELIRNICTLNPDYVGQYDISVDIARGIFNLTIIHVTKKDNGRKLVCSDGSWVDSHFIRVTRADVSILQTSKTDNRNPDAYGKGLTLTCLFTRNTFAVVWRYADNIAKIAECRRNKCTLNTHYAEQYTISADMRRCMFNLTIRKVVSKNNGQTLMCSDGSYSDYYIIRVKDYRPRFEESPNTITATSACVSKEMNVSFKWLKKSANNGIEKVINPKFRDKYTTPCSNLSTFGNDHEIQYIEKVPAKPSNEGNYSLKILAIYDNEGIESSTSVTKYTIIEEPEYKDKNNINVWTEPTNVAAHVILKCLAIIICIALTVCWRYVCYQKKHFKQPGKQEKKMDTDFPKSSGVQENARYNQNQEAPDLKNEEMNQLLPQTTNKSNGDVSQEPEDDDVFGRGSTENHSQDVPESKNEDFSLSAQIQVQHVFKNDENRDMSTGNLTGMCPQNSIFSPSSAPTNIIFDKLNVDAAHQRLRQMM